MSCPDCKPNCNDLFHELVHGNISLTYCIRKAKQGKLTDELIERMDSDNKRIAKALKSCIRACD